MTETTVPLVLALTAAQRAEFTACADTCGLDLATWVLQCAAVKAAAVIDAVQTAQRRERLGAAPAPRRPRKRRNEGDR